MAFIKLDIKSMALMRGVSVNIILPTDGMAQEVRPPYKTLYFLPGYSADSIELYTYLRLRAHAELKGIAVVIPDGENSFYQDYPHRNTYYGTYVGKELVEMTRNLLPLSHRREDTYIGGISMGGYGALLNGLKYHNTFSKIIVFSPVTDCYELMVEQPVPGFSPKMFAEIFGSKEEYYSGTSHILNVFDMIGEPEQPEIFLCCGRQDRMVYRQVKELTEQLTRRRINYTFREENGDHELDYWERMMDPGFSFLAGIKEGTKSRLVIPGK